MRNSFPGDSSMRSSFSGDSSVDYSFKVTSTSTNRRETASFFIFDSGGSTVGYMALRSFEFDCSKVLLSIELLMLLLAAEVAASLAACIVVPGPRLTGRKLLLL